MCFRSVLIIPLFLFLFFAAIQLTAQSGQGILTGVVKDASNNESLPGVSVYVNDTGRGTTSDVDGKYNLSLPAGSYSLTFTFVGYEIVRTEVTLEEGQTRILNVSIQPSVTSFDEVVVEAKRLVNTENAVLTERMKSISVQDGISAENMLRTASITTTQALQKVTGVSTRDDRSISVRGLTERNIVVQLNGSRLSSSDPLRSGGVSLDILPAQLLDNISVKKTFTPDNPGDATAAIIELKTRSLPDTLSVSVTVQAGFNERVGLNGTALLFPNSELGFFGQKAEEHRLSPEFINMATVTSSSKKDFNLGNATVYGDLPRQIVEGRNTAAAADKAYRINALQEQIDPYLAPTPVKVPVNQIYSLAVSNMFKIFGEKRLGALIGVNYYSRADQIINATNNRYQIDERAVTPNNVQLTSRLNFREDAGTLAVQYGAIGILTYKINKANEVSANYILNRGSESSGLLLSSIRKEDNFFGYQLSTSIRSFDTYQFRGEHQLNILNYKPHISWVASSSTTKTELPDFRNAFLLADTSGRVVDGEFKREYYKVSNITRFFRNLEEFNKNIVADITLPVVRQAIKIDFKTGVWYLERKRNYNQQLLLSPTNNSNPANLISYLDGLGGSLEKARGNLNNWLTPDIIGISESNSRNGVLVPGYNYNLQTGGGGEQGPGAYNALQRIASVYAMMDVSLSSRLQITAGMRAEDTDTRVTVDTLGVAEGVTSIRNYLNNYTVDQQEIQWLPSGIATFRLNPLMNFRFAASKSLNRPEIGELTPIRTYDATQLAFISGNQKLKNATYTNLDFRWEYFPKKGRVFSASLFYKKINNGLEKIFLPAPNNSVIDNELPLSTISFRNNSSPGQVIGIELEAVRNLDFIANALRNVNVGVNVLLAKSETKISSSEYYTITQFDRTYDKKRPIFEQPNVVFNANVGYDWLPQQASANLYFNYTGSRLIEIYTDGTPNIYEHPAPQFDFAFTKVVLKRWQIKGFVKNILDARTDYIYQKSPDSKTYGIFNQTYYRRQFTRGRSYSIGISYAF